MAIDKIDMQMLLSPRRWSQEYDQQTSFSQYLKKSLLNFALFESSHSMISPLLFFLLQSFCLWWSEYCFSACLWMSSFFNPHELQRRMKFFVNFFSIQQKEGSLELQELINFIQNSCASNTFPSLFNVDRSSEEQRLTKFIRNGKYFGNRGAKLIFYHHSIYYYPNIRSRIGRCNPHYQHPQVQGSIQILYEMC